MLRIYTLGPNDTLFVDNGDYPALYPTVISPLAGINDDHGFVLSGPMSANRVASLHQANPLTQAPVPPVMVVLPAVVVELSAAG